MVNKRESSLIQRYSFQRKILDWYAGNKRDLPWRQTNDPYKILISEVMLQQTQVRTVIPYYNRWISRFDSFEKLAEASIDEVLMLWEGMGYYQRAKNLHRAAGEIVKKYQGQIPPSYEKLILLPGIGPYTAGAIASIVFNISVPAIDANVRRIFTRLFCLNKDAARSQKTFFAKINPLIDKNSPSDFNQALMDLGALICVARNPLCHSCPVYSCCLAYKKGLQNKIPLNGKAKKIKKIKTVIGIIINRGRIYIQKRPPHGLFGGLWEFPGGKIKSNETPEKALLRELREEIGAEVKIEAKEKTILHSYTRFRVTLFPFFCRMSKQNAAIQADQEFLWILPKELNRFAFPAANRKIINSLYKNLNFLHTEKSP